MTFCLGTFLRTVQKYEVDQSKTDISFVNGFLENLLECSTGGNSFNAANFNKVVVSKILNCKYNAPYFLKKCINDDGLQKNLSDCLCCYAKKNLQDDCSQALSSDVLGLCNKNNKSQHTIYNKLKALITDDTKTKSNTGDDISQLSTFIACALIEAVKISNIVNTDCMIGERGNSKLYVHAGDIFSYAFNKKNKNINIIVIPVNTRFDTHISREFEGHVKQVVSINTLQGMWIERMMRRSNTKTKVDNEWIECNEDALEQRILNDLNERQEKPKNGEEYAMGTIAVIQEESTIFYLLTASRFDENNNARASKSEIKHALKSLVKFYDQNGQGFDIYLPLIGTGMSRTGFSNQESFDEICNVFNPENNSYVGKVTIVALPEVFENLDLGVK